MIRTTTTSGSGALPRASLRETCAVLADVIAPTLAKGVIIRRPGMVALAARLDLDRRAIRRMQSLRDKYRVGPLLLPIPGRPQALILAPDHVRRVLDGTPEPFTAASDEKRAALAHFQPGGVLISCGPARVERRRFNETVLDTALPAHRLAGHFLAIVAEEAGELLGVARVRGELNWDLFTGTWSRIARRVVLGDAARDDHVLTALLAQLRTDANWAFLRPRRNDLRERFFARLHGHLARAEPGSLAGVLATTPVTEETAPAQQVAHWLFAFDAAGIATFRALALLATHPEQATRARGEIASRNCTDRRELPYLRAAILEALRLWPTTPAVLRQSTTETVWEAGVMPARTGIVIFAPFFHRDDRRLSEADRFAPELWPTGWADEHWPLIPFSGGPAMCPARNLVLLLTSAMLAALLDGRPLRLLAPPRIDPDRPLPGTLNHFALRFAPGG
jgi:cytochrome P450